MRLGEPALFTDDPDRLVDFYARLIGADPTSRWDGGAVFRVGAATILIHRRMPPEPSMPPNVDHFAFEVADVDRELQAVRERGVEAEEPRTYPWGRSAYLTDPDGRLVELHEDGSAATDGR